MIRVLLSCSFRSTVTKNSWGIPSHASSCRRISRINTRFFSHDIKHNNKNKSINEHDYPHQLSSNRAQKALQLLPTYLSDARSVTKYHPIDSPHGALQLSVAENLMLEDLIVPWLRMLSSTQSSSPTTTTTTTSHVNNFDADQIYYQPTHGRIGLRKAMAGYLTRLLHINQELDENGLIIGAGCNAVLENLCFCLTEPGDGVLIPTPYYAAFDFDLGSRIGLTLIPVVSSSYTTDTTISSYENTRTKFINPSQYYPTRQSLDSAYFNAKQLGHPPKVLLLSHPNNPLGIFYPSSVLRTCIEWARERHVHLVSDEIYAGSVYRQPSSSSSSSSSDVNMDSFQNTGSFQSILKLAASFESSSSSSSLGKQTGLGLGPYIHFVYALSKDFALSGLRVGVAYSENETIRLPLQKLNDLCQVSSQTQLTVESMLNSQSPNHESQYPIGDTPTTKSTIPWSTDLFLEQGRKRLRERCDRLQQCLQENDIPFIPADSGMFLWIDMSEFLPQSMTLIHGTVYDNDMIERQLYLELLDYGLLFTPGRSMKNEYPGFFRCVFTAATDQGFDIALERINKFVRSKRKM